ncbi:TIGR03557 family F420-dependent LLM class oxidoreductase [Microbacterium paludicola]|uniref:TIGR03557 family F420-dependent LLM class oxidoreductase n=1 Tax=Microbacterium paludicola TaxID=300019 RepID=UPI0011A6CFF5|nr:TIGR03557 family F420-dependent LLM class oxidoreductase [Microbacterium paludicola]
MVSVRREVHHVVALEQSEPAEAVAQATAAIRSGFAGTVLFDRFQPWLPQQHNAPFAWAVAGAIGQQSQGSIAVSAAPGYRMHPAVAAQAIVTLAALQPGRHRLLLSAGDAIDEHVVGGYWPEVHERTERLFEAAEIIRKLFSASVKDRDTRHSGSHFRLETARLWTMPHEVPKIQVWAGGPVTARRSGRVADGMIVHAAAPDRIAVLLAAHRDGMREAGKAESVKTVHVQLSWAHTDHAAIQNALSDWPMAGLRFPRGDIRSPFDVAQLARSVTADDICARIPVSSDPDVHRAHLQTFLDMGFDTIHVHNVGRNQAEWIDIASRDILPKLVS